MPGSITCCRAPCMRASRPHIVGSVRRLVQFCGDACHGRSVALRRFRLLAASRRLFDRLWYGEANAISNAIGYPKHRSRSHDAVVRVYSKADVVIETQEHKVDFKEAQCLTSIRNSGLSFRSLINTWPCRVPSMSS